MVNTLSLVLPVLIPSWRFFKAIDPSPRVQWALICDREGAPITWHEFRPRPLTVTPLQMVFRLFWNPDWNDALFVVSCAERIKQQPNVHSINEIMRRIQLDIGKSGTDTTDRLLQFRLIFVHREETALVEDVVFLSQAVPVNSTKVC
jgi:hypothetical protein